MYIYIVLTLYSLKKVLNLIPEVVYMYVPVVYKCQCKIDIHIYGNHDEINKSAPVY